jgi:hypothetical protein
MGIGEGTEGGRWKWLDLVPWRKGEFSPCESWTSLDALCSNFNVVWWERSGDEDITSCISLPLPEQVPDLVR